MRNRPGSGFFMVRPDISRYLSFESTLVRFPPPKSPALRELRGRCTLRKLMYAPELATNFPAHIAQVIRCLQPRELAQTNGRKFVLLTCQFFDLVNLNECVFTVSTYL